MCSSAIAFITLILLTFSTDSTARELRPSDHGLEYQSQPPTELKSPGMISFFGSSSSSSSSSSTPNTMALPKAMNSTDTPWWGGGYGSRNRRERDHVRHVLLLGSLVCGVTGVALLAASALIYVIKIKSSSPSNNNNNNANNVNGLVLVPISK